MGISLTTMNADTLMRETLKLSPKVTSCQKRLAAYQTTNTDNHTQEQLKAPSTNRSTSKLMHL